MDIQPDVSVCIVPAMVDADLSGCVESILAQNDPVLLELFLPVGCGLESRFAEQAEIHFIDYPHGHQGDNVYHVWQQATGRYLAVFYSSIIAGAGSFFAMLEFLDDHPDVGGAAPRLFSQNHKVLINCFRNAIFSSSRKKMGGWDGFTSLEVDWLSPDAFFINRIAFEDCSAKSFKGKIWSQKLCKDLKSKGWHQFFVHYSRGICQSFFQIAL